MQVANPHIGGGDDDAGERTGRVWRKQMSLVARRPLALFWGADDARSASEYVEDSVHPS